MAVPEIASLRYRNKVIESLCFRLAEGSACFVFEGEEHVNGLAVIFNEYPLSIYLIVCIIARSVVRIRGTRVHHFCAEGEGQTQTGRHHGQLGTRDIDVEGAEAHICLAVIVHIIGIKNLILAQGAVIACRCQRRALEPDAVPHIQGHGLRVLGNLHIKGNTNLILPQRIRKPADLVACKIDFVQLVGSPGGAVRRGRGRRYLLKRTTYWCSYGPVHRLRNRVE